MRALATKQTDAPPGLHPIIARLIEELARAAVRREMRREADRNNPQAALPRNPRRDNRRS